MPKWKALPIFSSDALSSVGYGPEQIAIVLASVPTLATYRYFGPIVLAIIALLFIVALSYTPVSYTHLDVYKRQASFKGLYDASRYG